MGMIDQQLKDFTIRDLKKEVESLKKQLELEREVYRLTLNQLKELRKENEQLKIGHLVGLEPTSTS